MERCKFGKLKNPTGKRRCKRKAKHGKSAKRKCPYGKLKNPTGKRICKRKRGGVKRRMSKAAQEAYMWRSYNRG